MIRGVFITGTDTNVGKTVVAAALMHRYRHAGPSPLCYWKPIQTGIEQDDDTVTVRALAGCAEAEIFDQGVRLPRPLSPHLAARLAGSAIEMAPLLNLIELHREARRWIVEGAGGALVPLNQTELIADLMVQMALPVIVVARSTLGTINHTLLTIEALRRRSLHVAGVVMVGERNAENRAAIERYGEVCVLGEMPRFASLEAVTLGAWAHAELDPDGRLLKFLG